MTPLGNTDPEIRQCVLTPAPVPGPGSGALRVLMCLLVPGDPASSDPAASEAVLSQHHLISQMGRMRLREGEPLSNITQWSVPEPRFQPKTAWGMDNFFPGRSQW